MNVDLNSILKQLIEEALQDGVITPEEKELIAQIKLDVETYITMLNKALEDNIITPEERSLLISFEEKILNSAWDLAEKDAIITEDENRIIQLLFKILASINYDSLTS